MAGAKGLLQNCHTTDPHSDKLLHLFYFRCRLPIECFNIENEADDSVWRHIPSPTVKYDAGDIDHCSQLLSDIQNY